MRWPSAALVLLVGCHGKSLPIDEAGHQQRLSTSVAAGSEATLCQYLRLDGAVDIERFEHTHSGASHHFFIYEADTPDASAVFDCEDGHDLTKSSLVYASQDAHGMLAYPPGVAFHLPAERTLLIEWHLVNTHTEAMQADATLDIGYTRDPPEHRAGMLAYYQPFIHVAPHAESEAVMHCRLQENVTLFWASSHMHRRGTRHVSQARLPDGAVIPLFETDSWSDPEVRLLDDLPVAAGTVVEYGCTFRNDTASPIIEGASALNNEMCMFFAGYYPRMPAPFAEACSGAESGPRFNGDRSCAESLACLEQATSEVLREQCWVGTSAAATELLLDVAWRCAAASCGEACGMGDFSTDCSDCLADRCASQRAACISGGPAAP